MTEQERQAEILKDAYKTVLDLPQGRIVLNDILNDTTVEHNSAGISHFKTNETFFNQGKNAIGLILKRKLQKYSPSNFIKLINNQ